MPFPFASAVAGAAAGLAGGGLGIVGQKMANEASAVSVDKQMQFQERMAGSAWSRAVQDMRNAGLNPALAYSQGPASAPAGATYQPENELSDFGQSLERGISSASGQVRLEREGRSVDSAIAVQDSTIAANTASAAQSLAQAKQLDALRVKTGHEGRSAKAEGDMNDMLGGVGKLVGKVAEYLPANKILGPIFRKAAGRFIKGK